MNPACSRPKGTGYFASSICGKQIIFGSDSITSIDDVTNADGFIYISHDYGSTWRKCPEPGATGWDVIKVSHDGKVIAAAGSIDDKGSFIYVSVDHGETWNKCISAGKRNWGDLEVSPDGKYIVALSDEEEFVRTIETKDLHCINHVNLGKKYFWHVETVSDTGTIIVTDVFGGAYITTNHGNDWSEI